MADLSDKTARELHSIRDTIESVWVAIILAFVLRAFIIEAFVIPTGSMAPRLMGRHWDLTCPTCGYEFSYGVPRIRPADGSAMRGGRTTPTGAVCPNCNAPFPYNAIKDYARGGDRVLVMKYLYHFVEPKPWDVVVFRNPQNNRENYIKRLIGVPGETIEIIHGDLFVRTNEGHPDGAGPWRIRRKPQRAQQAMWQVVYDNDYYPDANRLSLEDAVAPQWRPERGWEYRANPRAFSFAAAERSSLIFEASRGDFEPHYGYNYPSNEAQMINPHRDICTDLKLSVAVAPGGENTKVALSLSSFEHRFQAQIHADGTVLLLHRFALEPQDAWQEWGRAQVQPLKATSPRAVALVHADFRVSVVVDGKEVLASSDEQYPADYEWIKKRMMQAGSRPVPVPEVEIAAWDGPCELTHVKLYRDVYYTTPTLRDPERGVLGDYAREAGVEGRRPGWGVTGNPIVLRRKSRNGPSPLDEFFVMGDNSPQSHDGRAWTSAAPTLRLYDQSGEPIYRLGTVPRYNLIGKAFFVYWPAGFHVPGLERLPLVPNVGRMRLIR